MWPDITPSTTFLLSPAHSGGRRARQLLDDDAEFLLARQLRTPIGVPLGEVFSFISGLYFRGKLAYASRFRSPGGAVYIISTNRGLMSPDTFVTVRDLREFGTSDISEHDPVYREALERDLRYLETERVVFLGSIATVKYLKILSSILGERLYYPRDFIGSGELSRGTMLLRAARTGQELEYVSASRAPEGLRAVS